MWVPVIDHIVRQAKLSDNTLEKCLCYLLGAQLHLPLKYMQLRQVYLVKRYTGENGIATICTYR